MRARISFILATLLVIACVQQSSGNRTCKAIEKTRFHRAGAMASHAVSKCSLKSSNAILTNSADDVKLVSTVYRSIGTTKVPLPNAIAFIYSKDGPKPIETGKRFTLIFEHAGLTPSLAIVSEGTVIDFKARDDQVHSPGYHGIMPFGRAILESLDDYQLKPRFYSPIARDAVKTLGVVCDIHPDERASVWVVPAQQFAISDAEGRFDTALRLSPGMTTLIIARPGYKSQSFPIRLMSEDFRDNFVLEKEQE